MDSATPGWGLRRLFSSALISRCRLLPVRKWNALCRPDFPQPIKDQTGIDGTDTYLRTETAGDLVDQFRPTDSSTIHTHLIGTGIKQSLDIGQLIDTSAYGEGDVDLLSHTGDHLGEGLAALEAGGDIEEAELVGSLLAIGLA